MRVYFFSAISIALALAMMPLGHSAVALLRLIEDPWYSAYANIAIGMLGFSLIWLGVKKTELQASLLGFIGAHFMFVGFFEFTFSLYAKLFSIQPLLNPVTGEVILSPSLQVNEASFFILLPLFLLFYANRQVRCNMIVWLRKTLCMKTGNSTERSKERSYASIAANETLFIIWMIYAISLITLDPRILGATHWASMLIYSFFMIWPLYLIFRITKIRTTGMNFRYAIPIGILLWSWVEMFASMDLIYEFYLEPLVYPLYFSLILLLAIILFTTIYSNKFSLDLNEKL